ncbi:MAG: ExbD/TolR family protein [Planctomycetota bacterium]
MRFARKSQGRGPSLNLASMIDATFLLLAFFLVTTGAGIDEGRLAPNLRVEQGTDAKDDLEPQVLEVRRDGDATVFVLGSRQLVERAELVSALEPLSRERGLFVRVYPGVRVDAAATAIQVARDAGFEAVTYVPAK